MGSNDDDGVGSCVEDDEPTGIMKKMIMIRDVILNWCSVYFLARLILMAFSSGLFVECEVYK